jgi:hypothetical protein
VAVAANAIVVVEVVERRKKKEKWKNKLNGKKMEQYEKKHGKKSKKDIQLPYDVTDVWKYHSCCCCLDNVFFFHIFHIFSLFTSPFLHIFHIFSLFNLLFFHFSIYLIDIFVLVLCFKHTRRQSLVLM